MFVKRFGQLFSSEWYEYPFFNDENCFFLQISKAAIVDEFCRTHVVSRPQCKLMFVENQGTDMPVWIGER